MIIDLMVLVLLAIADLAVIAYLRRRHQRQGRSERMTASLCFAVSREIDVEASRPSRFLLHAS